MSMILIGMFDSPFVRRVAVTMDLLGLPFDHRNWSVGKDFERIREYNPLGRVPTLVLPDGDALMESAAILDFIDDSVGPARALLPPSGLERRRALRLMAIATGAAEKAVLQIYERVFRPEEKRHEGWLERCRAQVDGALAELERAAATRTTEWLASARMTQADITVTCVYTFVTDALAMKDPQLHYPAVSAVAARCEALPVFAARKLSFYTPASTGVAAA